MLYCLRSFVVRAVPRKFRFYGVLEPCLSLPCPQNVCTWVYAMLYCLRSLLCVLCPVNFGFYVVLEPSLSLPLPRNCTREFMQFILLEEFVVPRKCRFYSVLEPSLPYFWFGHVSSCYFILLVEFVVRPMPRQFSLLACFDLDFPQYLCTRVCEISFCYLDLSLLLGCAA